MPPSLEHPDSPAEPRTSGRFAETFARRPPVPPRGWLPGRRVWATVVFAGVLTAAIASDATAGLFGVWGSSGSPQPALAQSAADLPAPADGPVTPGTRVPAPTPTVTVTVSAGGHQPAAPAVKIAPPPAGQTGNAPPGSTGGSTGGNASAGSTGGNAPANPASSPQTQPTPATTTTPVRNTTQQQAVKPPPPPPAPAPGRMVFSHDSGRCIDVTDKRAAAGTPLQIWSCTGADWQKWDFRSDGTVRSVGFCMEVAGGSSANGSVIRLGACNGGAAQRFVLNSRHDLVNTAADKCVDVVDHNTANGARLQLWSCVGTDNQKWSFK
ncbi:hypothetical protein Pth03_09890 [Planotetraspora thailandica]|uniref:Ricin B lectin domain-containing protein n=1 Tax=Planotetraspora thailandica TaxID=487172 RepID=A0A8J3UXU0_9ACTN|nr:RICIN domain-containing protein [Planotetraspora thailandica]GII52600.1 hypothetical protein Pth03_09890 [Planotetraspora thailandica]